MKHPVLSLAAALALVPLASPAQTPPPPLPDLVVTLPTGKVVTFPTLEAKEKYLAALARAKAGPTTPPPDPQAAAAASQPPKVPAQSSLTLNSNRPGVGNAGAPIFTADYYLGRDPDSWVGKNVTLSVGYLRPMAGAPLQDGLRPLLATTFNTATGKAGEVSGGRLLILATPEQAQKLLVQCVTRSDQYTNDPPPSRVSLIRGEFGVPQTSSSTTKANQKYCLYVR